MKLCDPNSTPTDLKDESEIIETCLPSVNQDTRLFVLNPPVRYSPDGTMICSASRQPLEPSSLESPHFCLLSDMISCSTSVLFVVHARSCMSELADLRLEEACAFSSRFDSDSKFDLESGVPNSIQYATSESWVTSVTGRGLLPLLFGVSMIRCCHIVSSEIEVAEIGENYPYWLSSSVNSSADYDSSRTVPLNGSVFNMMIWDRIIKLL